MQRMPGPCSSRSFSLDDQPRAPRKARGSGSRSVVISLARWTATSPWRARPGRALRSLSSCRHLRPLLRLTLRRKRKRAGAAWQRHLALDGVLVFHETTSKDLDLVALHLDRE